MGLCSVVKNTTMFDAHLSFTHAARQVNVVIFEYSKSVFEAIKFGARYG